MDVIFQPQKGDPFAIEIGFFDTVLEIKEKIQKYHKIPILQQTLIFNGKILHDDSDVESAEILQLSRIQLISDSQSDQQQQQHQHLNQSPTLPSPPPPPSPVILNLNIKIPSTKSQFPIEIDPNDSIRRLKERIVEIDAAVGPINRLLLVLQSNASAALELHDHRSLLDCEVSDNADIEVRIRPVTAVTAAAAKNKLKIIVMPKCGTLKIPMEVNAMDNVGELKKELQKQQQKLQFNLPAEGFFFIYDRDVMDEDRTFRWHGVAQGDTIEIFNGNVTGGS